MTNHPRDRHLASPEIRGGGVPRERGAARVTPLLVLLVIVLLGVVAALLMPVALRSVGGPTRQWERLSFMADVFTAGFGALIVVTVVVAAGAFWFQAREYRAMRELGIRTEGRELAFKALDDPELLAVWGGPADPSMRDDDERLLLYANQLMNFRQLAYDSGGMTDAEVRIAAREFFSGRIGRAYWAGARGDRAAAAGDRTERRFHAIVDEEYRAARRRPPAPDEPLVAAPAEARRGGSGRAVAVAAAAGAGIGLLAGGYVVDRVLGWRRGR